MKMNNDWQALFDQEIQKDYLKKIDYFLAREYKTKHIYPAAPNIFHAFQMTSLENTKVVIVGQDPYHGPGQAQGFSFSVPANFRLPPSLQNIYKELEMEYGLPIHRSGDLSDWAHQGVLLLNTILTVEEGKPLSHQNIGWQNFTNEAISWINKKEGPVAFLLWGAKAKSVLPLLTNPDHLILMSPHPSPFSANRGFFGNNHFKLANEYLISHGQTPIDWTRSNV